MLVVAVVGTIRGIRIIVLGILLTMVLRGALVGEDVGVVFMQAGGIPGTVAIMDPVGAGAVATGDLAGVEAGAIIITTIMQHLTGIIPVDHVLLMQIAIEEVIVLPTDLRGTEGMHLL